MGPINENILLVINAEKCVLIENPHSEECRVLMKLRGRQRIRDGAHNQGETVVEMVKVRRVLMQER